MRERSEAAIATDITIYGATSFVAKHVIRYLKGIDSSLPRKLNVTLAGRNETKLQKVLAAEVTNNNGSQITFDIVAANSTDTDALDKMTARTRVVLNCAGPFELYSSGVVAACARQGCDYVDITGEVGWAGDMRVKHGATAAKSGARIISLCGFDSIPSDLAVFAAVRALRENNGAAKEIESARTWHACMGMAGGGTVSTMQKMKIDLGKCLFQTSNDGSSRSLRKVPFVMFDPLVLTHPESTRFNPDCEEARNRMALSEWVNYLPFSHTILKQGFSIPFFMAVCNAKVVQASAIALKYGPKFSYKERMLPMGFNTTMKLGRLSVIPACFMLWVLAVAGIVVKLPVIGEMLVNLLLPPGTGASDAMCEQGYAEVYAEVKAPRSEEGRVSCANAYMEFQGDPGNYVTAQCVTESALALVLDRKELPPRSSDGFGTPAELLGPVLLKRLTSTKVRPVTIKTNVRDNERNHEFKLYM